MSDQYKVPPLLPLPYIIAMVLAALLPIAAIMYLLGQQSKVQKLEEERRQIEADRLEKLNKVAQRGEMILQQNKYENLVAEFNQRFFAMNTVNDPSALPGADADHKKLLTEFWQKSVWRDRLGQGLDYGGPKKPYKIVQLGVSSSAFDKSKLQGFGDQFQVEFYAEGDVKALWQFMRDIYDLKRRIYYPYAVYLRMSLPADVKIGRPGESGKIPILESVKQAEEDQRKGLFFEPSPDMPSRPDGDPWDGKLWWLGRTMTDEEQTTAEYLSRSDDWRKSIIPSLKDLIGKPMVSISSEITNDTRLCPVTFLDRYGHDVPLFYYFEYFYIEPSPQDVKDRHKIHCKIVIPLRQGLVQGQPQ